MIQDIAVANKHATMILLTLSIQVWRSAPGLQMQKQYLRLREQIDTTDAFQ